MSKQNTAKYCPTRILLRALTPERRPLPEADGMTGLVRFVVSEDG
ncbi:MAG TPA: hypothetical protein VN153_08440 [Tahibacter sp.]|jgi:hypothetical protein|nr:hypothetical protein [Tahibacter sp.]